MTDLHDKEKVITDNKLGRIMFDLAEGKVEYKALNNGTIEDKLRYIEKHSLKIVGIIIQK